MDAGSPGEDGSPLPRLSGRDEGRGGCEVGWLGAPHPRELRAAVPVTPRRLEGCPFDPTNGADLTRSLKRNIHLKTLMLRRGSLERGDECPPVLAPQLERLS